MRSMEDLDRRVRDTLHAVASTVTEPGALAPVPPASVTSAPRPGRRRLRFAAVLAAVALPLAAAAYVAGSEYVDQLPPRTAIVTGDAHGERYWLIPGRVRDDCGQRTANVELVLDRDNEVGQEWSTVGTWYGDPIMEVISQSQGTGRRCGVDESAWLADARNARRRPARS